MKANTEGTLDLGRIVATASYKDSYKDARKREMLMVSCFSFMVHKVYM